MWQACEIALSGLQLCALSQTVPSVSQPPGPTVSERPRQEVCHSKKLSSTTSCALPLKDLSRTWARASSSNSRQRLDALSGKRCRCWHKTSGPCQILSTSEPAAKMWLQVPVPHVFKSTRRLVTRASETFQSNKTEGNSLFERPLGKRLWPSKARILMGESKQEPFSAVAIGSAIGGTFGGAIGALIDARRANIDVEEIRAAAIRSQQPRRPFTYSDQTVSMTELTPGG